MNFFNNDKNNNTIFKINGELCSENNKFKSGLYNIKKTKSKTKKQKDDEEINDESNNENKYELYKTDNYDEIIKMINNLTKKNKYNVLDIEESKSYSNPSPPFTTSTLQQEASRKFGFSVKQTMDTAQRLYEQGYITYMRTDSISLSKEALEEIKEYVLNNYGENYHKYKNYKSTGKNTQEAHEAIRPSHIDKVELNQSEKIGHNEIKLYSLIWKRTVASQMEKAIYKVYDYIIGKNKDDEHVFISQYKKLIFNGYLAVYNIENVIEEENDENKDNKKLKLEINDEITIDKLISSEEYNKPPTRYNEPSLINKLDPKNLNIGRPSTYATIISTIFKRDYVKLEDIKGVEKDCRIITWENKSKKIKEDTNKITLGKENKKIVPTELGKKITKYLDENFINLMNYKFTSDMEDLLDDIACGKVNYIKVLDDFYKPFIKTVSELKEKTKENNENKKLNERILGIHPTYEKEIIACEAKYGDVVKINISKTNILYQGLKSPWNKDNITLDEAIKLFEYPKELGKHEKKKIVLNKGKYGLYLTYDKKNYTIQNEDENKENEEITLEKAIEIIKEKNKNILWSDYKNKTKYELKEGQYGRYVMIKKDGIDKAINVSIGDLDISELSIEKIEELKREKYNNKKKFIKKK